MSEQWERHGDAAAVSDCLKYHASAGGEYEYRGTLAVEAFDRICTTLLDIKAQRDELLVALKWAMTYVDADHSLGTSQAEERVADRARAAIAHAEARP